MSVKTIFLDIGGVTLSNGWGHESRQEAARTFGFDYGEMNRLHDFIYNVFEIGSISLDAYLDTVLFYRPRNFTKADFKAFMYAQSVELPGLLPWLKKWKQQCRFPVFAINNESRELNAHRIATFGLHELFDGFFSSCYMGLRKPDPRIFQKALEITQTKPRESFYVDDRPMLVEAAEKLGMNACQHQGYEHTVKLLEQLTLKHKQNEHNEQSR